MGHHALVGAAEPDTPRGKVAERALATRAALLDLAADLFAEQGYIQTSIRDVARRGGLTTGAIYGHFKNKADLLVEAINVRTAEELESRAMGGANDGDYVATLTRLAAEYPNRRRLRALIVQGAAAAQTDPETREKLREEQLAHLNAWIEGYRRDRDAMGIHPDVDIEAAVLSTWALEVGLGVMEAVGIEPRSSKAWSDIQNRLARSFQLPPDTTPLPAGKRARRRR